MTERTATVYATTVETPQSTAGMTAPFASRINKLVKPIMLMLHRLFSTAESTLHAWYTTTENADLERVFRSLLATVRNAPRAMMKCIYEHVTNTKVQYCIPGNNRIFNRHAPR